MLRPSTEVLLIVTQAIQVVFLLLHDWIPLGRLPNLAAVRAIDFLSKRLWTRLLSTLFFAIGLGVSVATFPNWPMRLRTYLEVLYTISLVASLWAWWIPYLSPSDSARAERYRTRFAGTLGFLPKRHGFARCTPLITRSPSRHGFPWSGSRPMTLLAVGTKLSA
ncbi:MAG TPA: hypothetical protein VMD53_16075 [Rhizomicrobium sp.]|nr:hypothetical protein [Rhizomicrobium sp.]